MKFYFPFLFISKTHFELVKFKFKYIQTFTIPTQPQPPHPTQQFPHQPFDRILFFLFHSIQSFIHYARFKTQLLLRQRMGFNWDAFHLYACIPYPKLMPNLNNIYTWNRRKRSWHEKALKWLTKTKTCYYGVQLHADHGAVTTTKTEL